MVNSTRKFHLLVNGNESDENVQTSSPKDHLIFFKNHIEKVKIVENQSQCTFIMLRSIVRGMLMVLISATLIEMSALLSTKSLWGGGGCVSTRFNLFGVNYICKILADVFELQYSIEIKEVPGRTRNVVNCLGLGK